MMTLLYTSQQITYIAILKTGKMRNSSVNEVKVLASHFENHSVCFLLFVSVSG